MLHREHLLRTPQARGERVKTLETYGDGVEVNKDVIFKYK